MKKTMTVLISVALALILLTGGLLWYFLSLLPKSRQGRDRGADVEAYLAENWRIFRVRSWDAEAAALELNFDLPFSYDQVVKYADAVEEIRQTPAGNLRTVEDLRQTVQEELGTQIESVTVYGLTTDGKTAYTACTDGSVWSCWESAEAP